MGTDTDETLDWSVQNNNNTTTSTTTSTCSPHWEENKAIVAVGRRLTGAFTASYQDKELTNAQMCVLKSSGGRRQTGRQTNNQSESTRGASAQTESSQVFIR